MSNHGNFKDITGKRFGNLSVVSKGKKEKTQYWICRCDCGKIKEVRVSHLTSGNTISCGCKFKNLMGLKFGRLVVLSFVEAKNNHHYWKCLCECGKEVLVNTTGLNNGNTKSCGCLQKERTSQVSTKHGLKKGNYKYIYNPEYYQYKRKNPLFLLKKNISCMIYHALRKKGKSKHGESVLDYLPYTLQELKEHIESQFEPWMKWENYGKWHIDHIMPQSKFNFNSMKDKEFIECWSLSNLRPLHWKDNLIKGDR